MQFGQIFFVDWQEGRVDEPVWLRITRILNSIPRMSPGTIQAECCSPAEVVMLFVCVST